MRGSTGRRADALPRTGLLGFSTTLLPPVSARPAHPPATSPSSSAAPPAAPPAAAAPESTAAVAQLQRTLVQFLGIVAFAPPLTTARPTPPERVRRTQDKVRDRGGLELLLSMCQMDERNTSASLLELSLSLSLSRTPISERASDESLSRPQTSRRHESLVDQHSRDRKAKPKSKDDDAPPGIWDRDRDMGVSGRLMDDGQRSNIIKNAKDLGGRFGGGSFL